MLLEDTLKDVSNRSSGESLPQSLPLPYLTEIKDAVRLVSNHPGEQETLPFPQGFHPFSELDDLEKYQGSFSPELTEQLDYQKLFSYLESSPSSEQPSLHLEDEKKKPGSAALSEKEAKELVQKVQLSQLTGGGTDASWEEKEKFLHFGLFNQSLLFLYHTLSPVRSSDVNYSVIRH